MLFRVRRRNQKFAGRVYQPGDIIDSDTVQLPAWKWRSLRQDRTGIFEVVDDPGVTRPTQSGRRICPDCVFVAKTPHGLTVHRGRAHKSSETASSQEE